MQKTINQNRLYEVTDLGLSGALLLDNFRLIDLNKTNPRKVIFLFEYRDNIKQAVNDYFSNNFQVDALEYFGTLRTLKNRIYIN